MDCSYSLVNVIQSKGARRDLTQKFNNIKRIYQYQLEGEQAKQRQRTHKKRRQQQSSTEISTDDDESQELIEFENKRKSVQMKAKNVQFPEWTIYQDQVEIMIVKGQEIVEQLKTLQAKKLKFQFSDSENDYDQDKIFDEKQADLEIDFKKLMRQCELKIQAIDKEMANEEELQAKIIKSMKESLLIKLKGIDTQFQAYKVQAKMQYEEYIFEKPAVSDDSDSLQDEGEQQQIVGSSRSKDIQKITSRMTAIHSLMKQMSTIVVDQDSILNRIDYNVEQSLKEVKKGCTHLEVTVQHSQRGKVVIYVQAMLIVIMTLILMAKMYF